MSESNLFAEKSGFTVHFKIEADDLNALRKNTELFIDWMKEHGYVHDTSRDRGRGGGGRAPQPPPTVSQNGHTVEIKCGRCGGQVYDNRQKNQERRAQGQKPMPEFKCKKQECGWILWDNEVDNFLAEQMPPSAEKPDYDAVPFE